MEHRCSRRVSLNINTLIYKHGVPVAMGRIKNGSSHGLYLETDYQNVRELQKLELEVLLGDRVKGNRRCCVAALVVRKSMTGVGLEMEMLEEHGAKPLREFIEQRQRDPHRMNRDLLANTAARAAQLAPDESSPARRPVRHS
ncbi:hypothetical protein [Marinimicrobium sp. LS-A18]|uniref:hypothetical protein n=1 Tax=Marinimicrobium sp. LS-A18 TaxID=1381596 RepID=UPI0004653A7E|nr:hypothetical protein [Marinimicrobium sp. LS-A18]